MRSLWLALLLAVTSSSGLLAEDRASHAHEPFDSVEHADHLPALELARSVVGIELAEREGGRSADLNGRGSGARSVIPPRFGAATNLPVGALFPADVPPAPSHAERLPYHATAPPLPG